MPDVHELEFEGARAGLRPGTPDNRPLIGAAPLDGLVHATGHYRNGILLTPITAKLVREWIVEKRVSMDWEIFDPLRFAGRNAKGTNSGDSLADSPAASDHAPRKFAHK